MLYNLFSNLVENYPIFNVFRYLTVRTGLSMFTSMMIVFLIGNPLINYFASNKIHNPIRSDGPTDHIVKKNWHTNYGRSFNLGWDFFWSLIMVRFNKSL